MNICKAHIVNITSWI